MKKLHINNVTKVLQTVCVSSLLVIAHSNLSYADTSSSVNNDLSGLQLAGRWSSWLNWGNWSSDSDDSSDTSDSSSDTDSSSTDNQTTATLWNISNSPLFLAKSADPLITLIWDDSGSMLLETSPESTDLANLAFPVSFSTAQYYATAAFGSNTNSKKVRDPVQNALFFDPFKEYKPWIKSDGTYFSDASYGSLYKTPNKIHPDDLLIKSSSSCKTMDLSDKYKPCYKYTYCSGFNNCSYNTSDQFWAGDFYYNGKSYRLKDTTKTYSTSWFYSGSPTVKTSEILAKAANWYTYYRDRKNVAKAALGYALQDIPGNVQMGFTTFSYADSHASNPLIFDYKTFSGSDKESLYDAIYNEDNAGGTPLREALLNVNNYIKNTDKLWFDGSTPLSCRRAYNIIISDGNWSDGTVNFNKNSDGTTGSKITGVDNQEYQYNPNDSTSYKDSYSGTLADIAMEFWKNDIRPDLNNTLFVPKDHENPAFWQHIVTHSISLNDDISTKPPTTWPNVISSSNSAQRYLDMWHASLNSKGKYLFSTDFESLKTSLSTFLHDASNLTSTVGFTNTGIENNGYEINGSSMLYKSFFNPITWSGEIKGFKLSSDGTILVDSNNQPWEASKQLPSSNNRKILAMLKSGSSTSTTAFRWSKLPQAAKDKLSSESVLEYFRGDRSNEGYQYSTGTKGFRVRTSPIGDFINAKPVFVGNSEYDYDYDNYANFKKSMANRTPVVYAANNGGFLHAFNANTGEELFAITPQLAFDQLNNRSKYDYTHKYVLDGTPKAGDAYFNGQWNTILVTTMATGGQGLFSINITNPDNINENNAPSLSGNGFWQFDDSNDKDLGYTFARPVISRINSSDTKSVWGVIVGNGYNNTESDENKSSTGNAVLYVLNSADGSIIKKIDTGVGKSKDPEGQGKPNGLSSPTVIDYNSDGKADFVYAGDIFGNIWKFNISDNDTSKWTAKKLFTNTRTPIQSITTAPDVKQNPTGDGVIVYVSTGRFIGESDTTSTQKNTIYAVLDDMSKTNLTLNDLQQQSITSTIESNGRNNRVISNNDIDWTEKHGWYLDLPNNELVLNRPKLSQGYLLISSYIPDANKTVCTNSQKGYLYALDPLTGGPLVNNVLDINNDNILDSKDLVDNKKISGIELATEFNSEPIIMKLNNDKNVIMLNTQEGNVIPIVAARNYTAPKRRSWKKIKSIDAETRSESKSNNGILNSVESIVDDATNKVNDTVNTVTDTVDGLLNKGN